MTITLPLPHWRTVDPTTPDGQRVLDQIVADAIYGQGTIKVPEPYTEHTDTALSLLAFVPNQRAVDGKPTGKCAAFHYTHIGGSQAVTIDVIDYAKPKHPRKTFQVRCDNLATGTVLVWLAMREWLEGAI